MATGRVVGDVSMLSPDELGDLMVAEGIDYDVSLSFVGNKISGAHLLQLNDGHLKELVPVLGDRLAVKSWIASFAFGQSGTQAVDSPGEVSLSIVEQH